MSPSGSGDVVEIELRVGMLDVALAKLISADHHTIEFPTILLPENVVAGSIVKLQCCRDVEAEKADTKVFSEVQQKILDSFATDLPKAPNLRARNITQTSVVLEWDPIDIATADLHFLTLYKDGERLGKIPQPLKRTVIKISNLGIDQQNNFQLVLSTSAGEFKSNNLAIQTHKMTDISGVVVCIGSLANSPISRSDIETTLGALGCKPAQDSVKLETTHFICTAETGASYKRALELNIPVVRPEWLQACETERRLVSVRGYYLSADNSAFTNVAHKAATKFSEETKRNDIDHTDSDDEKTARKETKNDSPENPTTTEGVTKNLTQDPDASRPAPTTSKEGANNAIENSNTSYKPLDESSSNVNRKENILEDQSQLQVNSSGIVDENNYRVNEKKSDDLNPPKPSSDTHYVTPDISDVVDRPLYKDADADPKPDPEHGVNIKETGSDEVTTPIESQHGQATTSPYEEQSPNMSEKDSITNNTESSNIEKKDENTALTDTDKPDTSNKAKKKNKKKKK